jgi:hypothetical protein
MISKELYKEISSQWKERIYQKYERLETRYPDLLGVIKAFEGKHVLEIGANAGMAAMEIAKVARQYTGVELAEGYYRQSLITKKYIENPNVSFNNCSVKSYIKRLIRGDFKDKPNACYLSYVLYHFEDKEVEMFKEHILPLLDVIVVQSRFAKRNIKGRTKHNSYGFWHPDNVEKYLKEAGFNTRLIWHKDKKFHLFVGIKEQLEEMITREGTIIKVGKNVDTGESGVYTESESAGSGGRGSREREGRPVEGQSRGDTGREDDTEGQGGDVLAEERGVGSEGVLQPVVEESTTVEVREADIPQVEKTVRTRRGPKTRKNSIGERKPDLQGAEA